MIKFVITCIIFVLIYFAFAILGQLDLDVHMTIGDYIVNTTFFTFIGFFITAIFVILIVLKISFSIFGLPNLIREKLYERKTKKIYYNLMQSMAQLIIGNKPVANKIVRDIKYQSKPDVLEFFNLISAELEEDFDKKIQYLKELIKLNGYKYFATKKLAQIFYDLSQYEQSKHYAILAFNMNKNDAEILEMLINCYAKLSLWEKFLITTSKLDILGNQNLSYLQNKISEYYIMATHEMLKDNRDDDAMNYLELALEFNPVSVEAIDLYCALNLSMHGVVQNLKIVEMAFAKSPSFELMEIYVKSSDLSPGEIYSKLESLAGDQEKHFALFLSIAAYLNLPEKFNVAKTSPKLLSYSDSL
jgi:uncharacterized protein HemY